MDLQLTDKLALVSGSTKGIGLAIATANARPELLPIAHYITQAPGGQGAVREVVELLLKAQGKWDGILKHYEISLEK